MLQACYDMLKKIDRAPFVTSPFEITVNYDDADCDGHCLMDDIATELEQENQDLRKAPDCLGRDNWKFLVEKYEKLLNTHYKDNNGEVYTFFGLVHASDDYYFGMSEYKTKKVMLLSCVCDIEDHGFKVYGEK